jgi:hypothetical protein
MNKETRHIQRAAKMGISPLQNTGKSACTGYLDLLSGQPEMLNETVSETINEHHHTAQPPLDLSVTFFQKPWENFLNPKYIPNYYIKESFGENLTPRNKTFIRSNF